jgi:RNase P subunit RPR2
MTEMASEKTDAVTVTVKKPVLQVSCLVCGTPFATEKQVRRVHEKLHFSQQVAATCPDCRGAKFRGAMEKVLSSQK